MKKLLFVLLLSMSCIGTIASEKPDTAKHASNIPVHRLSTGAHLYTTGQFLKCFNDMSAPAGITTTSYFFNIQGSEAGIYGHGYRNDSPSITVTMMLPLVMNQPNGTWDIDAGTVVGPDYEVITCESTGCGLCAYNFGTHGCDCKAGQEWTTDYGCRKRFVYHLYPAVFIETLSHYDPIQQ